MSDSTGIEELENTFASFSLMMAVPLIIQYYLSEHGMMPFLLSM